MAKKMTNAQMAEAMQAQAQKLAELQAKLNAMQAAVEAADARTKAAEMRADGEAMKALAAEKMLTEVAGDSHDVAQFDRDIRPDFDFGNYAIPGGDFAKEKDRPKYVAAKATLTPDDLFTYEMKTRDIDPNEYVRTHNGIFVYKDDSIKARHVYKAGAPHVTATWTAEAPFTKVRAFASNEIRTVDYELPAKVGRLEIRVLTDKEITQLVLQRMNTYVKPDYVFNLAKAKNVKLPTYTTPGGKSSVTKTTKAGATKRTPKGSKAAYISAFDQHAWGEFTLLRTDGLEDRRKVQRDGATVAAVIVKGNGYEITATEAKFQAAGINLDGAKKHGSRYVVTLDTPAQVMAFCQANR